MEKTENLNSTCTLQLSRENQNLSDKFKTTMTEAIDESLSSFKSLDKQEIYAYLETLSILANMTSRVKSKNSQTQ